MPVGTGWVPPLLYARVGKEPVGLGALLVGLCPVRAEKPLGLLILACATHPTH